MTEHTLEKERHIEGLNRGTLNMSVSAGYEDEWFATFLAECNLNFPGIAYDLIFVEIKNIEKSAIVPVMGQLFQVALQE